jgi:short-subunit dehydrogenase
VQKVDEETRDLDIGLVIPNAGAGTAGELVDAGVMENTDIVALNVTAPMQIANVFGSRLKQRRHGGILFVSSLVAYQGVPYLANYAATKAYILSLGESLNEELSPYGVHVSVLSPGYTDTAMPSESGVDFDKMPMVKMSTDRVARIGLRALGRKATVVPGLLNKIYAWENRFIPRSWPVKLFAFLLFRAMRKKGPEALNAHVAAH